MTHSSCIGVIVTGVYFEYGLSSNLAGALLLASEQMFYWSLAGAQGIYIPLSLDSAGKRFGVYGFLVEIIVCSDHGAWMNF